MYCNVLYVLVSRWSPTICRTLWRFTCDPEPTWLRVNIVIWTSWDRITCWICSYL